MPGDGKYPKVVRISTDAYDLAREAAEARGMSFGYLLSQLIVAGVARLPEPVIEAP